MTGAINYVRREGRYVMKYYLVAVFSIWRPPSDFLQLSQTWRNGRFYHLLFTPFADIALFLLNRKMRQCDKYYNGVPNSKISDVKNIYFVYGLSQVITDAPLDYIRLRVRIRGRSAGDWKCLSVNPAVDGCLFFSGL